MQMLLVMVALAACRGDEIEDTGPEDTANEPIDHDLDGSPADEDCDDDDASAYPGADELCDSVDNDCDGVADDDATDAATWYADADADGHGDEASSVQACAAPAGHVADDTDCDDDANAVHPGATEVCNGIDDDCVDGPDSGLELSTWYADADGDGDGDPATAVETCDEPTGHVATGADCDDTDPAVKSGEAGCGVPVSVSSCKELLDAGEGAEAVYELTDPSLPGGSITVRCDMSTDGGGWTMIGYVRDEAYDPAPPAIGPAATGLWSDWTAHAWRSGESYYLPLDTFDALTDGTSELMQVSWDVAGTIVAQLVYSDIDYDAVANTTTLGTCTDMVGSACSAGYSWKNYPPGFNGWGRSDYCNQGYPEQIWNYHPETGCASASGLFAYTGTTTARPQLLGSYTAVAAETAIMIR